MDPVKWAQTGHNPVRLLYDLDDARLDALSHNTEFLTQYRQVIDRFDAYLNGPTWFHEKHGDRGYVKVAYFSAEFGFHESLPIYSGGLGIPGRRSRQIGK